MNDRNDHVHRSQRTSRARVLAQIFGTLFLVTCLLASVIAVGLPGASRASSDQPTIKAAEDTYATSSAPGRSYAGSSRLEVRNDPRTLIFLKFAVQGYAAGSISNAHLRLYSATTSRSPVGLKLYSIDSSWREGDLTWQAQPALGTPLAEIAPAPIKNRQWVDFDLGAAIGGDGVYTLRNRVGLERAPTVPLDQEARGAAAGANAGAGRGTGRYVPANNTARPGRRHRRRRRQRA
ncbi:MAG: DNRLRE domain-containing protein [Kouleothrix sp.]